MFFPKVDAGAKIWVYSSAQEVIIFDIFSAIGFWNFVSSISKIFFIYWVFDNSLVTLLQSDPTTSTSIFWSICDAALIVLNVEAFTVSLLCSAITSIFIKLPLLHF